MKQLLDLNDITLIPQKVSIIDSRSECDTKYLGDNNYRQNCYPIFTAPMVSVVNQFNYKDFLLNNINPVIPRTVDLQTRIDLCGNIFAAFSLKEAYDIITDDIKINHSSFKICIDIANGHMSELLNTIHSLKIKYGSSIEIMSGNIANPDTYFEYARVGCDYVRCSIGTGQACTTSANSSIHYPIGSLILECSKVKYKLEKIVNSKNIFKRIFNLKNKYKGQEFLTVPKIIADGGMNNFDRIIKALACGADYVMLGQLLAQAWESAEPPIILKKDGINQFGGQKWQHIDNNDKHLLPFQVKDILKNSDYSIIKNYYGMSTKRAQKECGNTNLKTAEGIEKQIEVKYTLDTWVENFNHYLSSAMSYTECLNLKMFRELSKNAFKRNGLIQYMSPSAYFQYKK